MEQWIKRLGSALCASLLTVTLNIGIFADIDENMPSEDPPVPVVGDPLTPDEPQDDPETIPEDPDSAPADPDSVSEQILFAAAAPEAPGGNRSSPAPAGTDGSGSENESGTQQVEPLLVIGDEEIDLSAEASGSGWSYDAAEGWVYLNQYDGADQIIGTAGRSLTIKNSGLNHVGTLIVDGDLNLVGSGILLVDSIELADGKDLNLQTNTTIYPDGTGSVAVFLLKMETTIDADGNEVQTPIYELINDTVTGILDEDCTIPEGLTLRIPDGASILLQSVNRVTTRTVSENEIETEEWNSSSTNQWVTFYSTEPTYRCEGNSTRTNTTAPCLTVSETSRLIIEQASLAFHGITVTRVVPMFPDDKIITSEYMPSISVLGQLTLNASLQGALIHFGSNAVYEGSETLSDSTVIVDGGRDEALGDLSVNNSVVSLKGDHADLSSLEVSGNSTLVYTGESTIASVSMQSGSQLTVKTASRASAEAPLNLTGPVTSSGSGAEILLKSGILVLKDSCSVNRVSFNQKWPLGYAGSFDNIHTDENGNATSLGAIYDYKGILTPGDTPRVAVNPVKTDPNAPIPAELTTYRDLADLAARQGGRTTYYAESYDIGAYPVTSGEELLCYNDVLSYYVNKGELTGGPYSSYTFILETEQDGLFGYTVLDADSYSENTVKASEVTRIRVLISLPGPAQGGGGYATNSTTMYTGNGALGQGAGSIAGGSGSPVLSGSGIQNPITPKPKESPAPESSGSQSSDPEALTPDPSSSAPLPDEEPTENPNPAPAPEVAVNAEVWIEDAQEGNFVLRAANGEQTLLAHGGCVDASMSYTMPVAYAGKPLYAVFRVDGTLRAFRAVFDAQSETLSFRADCLGRFVIVGFDFDSEEFSDAFYEALELWIAQNSAI